MKVCYFGTYERGYPRNSIVIAGLRLNGIQVIECHVPVWELWRNKTGKFLTGSSLVKLACRILIAYLRLIKRYLQLGKHDLLMVGYIGQLDIFLLKAITFFNKKPIIFNPLVSLYTTLIIDRKIANENSIIARLLYILDKWSFKLADLILLDTNEQINYFQNKFKINGEKIRRVFVGAEEKYFYPRDIKKKNCPEFTVLFYGKFIPLQGLSYIIKAAGLLQKEEEIKFKIIGSGQLTSKIYQLTKRLETRNIQFIEWVNYKELLNYISNADICLGIFGDTEKAKRVIPNKAFQTIAAKKPLITGNSPAARNLFIDRKNAILCEMASPQAIAESILLLKKDRNLRETIAEYGYNLFLRKLSTAAIGKEMVNILGGSY